MTIGDIDPREMNEAFAAVPLKTMRDLDERRRFSGWIMLNVEVALSPE
jgi:acetyl-CoA acetyltransferase